jgi:hypothetical protein
MFMRWIGILQSFIVRFNFRCIVLPKKEPPKIGGLLLVGRSFNRTPLPLDRDMKTRDLYLLGCSVFAQAEDEGDFLGMLIAMASIKKTLTLMGEAS